MVFHDRRLIFNPINSRWRDAIKGSGILGSGSALKTPLHQPAVRNAATKLGSQDSEK